MKVKIKVEIETNLTTIEVTAGARYWEDSKVNGVEDTEGTLIPCRIGDDWCPIIDIDTGVITNWTPGVVADIHYKVCDDGLYVVRDSKGKEIFRRAGYVPAFMCPMEEGFGDYIIMEIDANGKIKGWKITPKDFENMNDE